MTRNRFELLARHIHFVDNSDFSLTDAQKKADKAWKIRPWISALQSNLKNIVPLQKQCVDEVMIAF